MKIKTDFVTNSSSTSYIFTSGRRLRRADIPRRFFGAFDSFRCFTTKKQLIAYTQEEPCTWIDEMRSYPHRFYNLPENEFEAMLNIILNGRNAVRLYLDRDLMMQLQDELLEKMYELDADFVMSEAH